jgi:sortase A
MTVRIRLCQSDASRKTHLLCYIQRFCFLIGIFFVGYYAYVQIDTRMFQSNQDRQFEQSLKDTRAQRSQIARSTEPIAIPAPDITKQGSTSFPVAASGKPLGKIDIQRIGLAAMILEGVDAKTLRRAVGHVPETALPGQIGNIAIAGHRDTFFRGLQRVEKNDDITLTTPDGSYRYLVDFSEVVRPDDIAVLNPSDDAILTLVTCYPFYYIGPAPGRFIVRAHRVNEHALAPQVSEKVAEF